MAAGMACRRAWHVEFLEPLSWSAASRNEVRCSAFSTLISKVQGNSGTVLYYAALVGTVYCIIAAVLRAVAF